MCNLFDIWRQAQLTLSRDNPHDATPTSFDSSTGDDEFPALSKIAAPEPVSREIPEGHVYIKQAFSAWSFIPTHGSGRDTEVTTRAKDQPHG